MEDIIEEGRKYEAAYLGDINTGAVLLGQSIGVINSLKTVKKIVDELVEDAEKRLKSAYGYLK